jgi:hypothetical protein
MQIPKDPKVALLARRDQIKARFAELLRDRVDMFDFALACGEGIRDPEALRTASSEHLRMLAHAGWLTVCDANDSNFDLLRESQGEAP